MVYHYPATSCKDYLVHNLDSWEQNVLTYSCLRYEG